MAMDDVTFHFLAVAEDGCGAGNVQRLTDRVLVDLAALGESPSLEWVDQGTIDQARRWERHEGRPFLTVVGIKRRAVDAGIRLQGRFGAHPPDTLMWRKLFVLLRRDPRPLELVVIARDSDRMDRRAGFEVALVESPPPEGCQAVYADMHPEAEAWRIAAFEPSSDEERSRHQEVRRQLGFDPVTHPERLTSTAGGERDAKRVHDELMDRDSDRSAACLEALLERLAQVSAACGLPRFLEEVRGALLRL